MKLYSLLHHLIICFRIVVNLKRIISLIHEKMINNIGMLTIQLFYMKIQENFSVRIILREASLI